MHVHLPLEKAHLSDGLRRAQADPLGEASERAGRHVGLVGLGASLEVGGVANAALLVARLPCAVGVGVDFKPFFVDHVEQAQPVRKGFPAAVRPKRLVGSVQLQPLQRPRHRFADVPGGNFATFAVQVRVPTEGLRVLDEQVRELEARNDAAVIEPRTPVERVAVLPDVVTLA